MIFLIKKWSSVLDEAQIDIETDKNIIFNCEESSFTHDPKDVKVIAKNGKRRVSKNIAGSGKKILLSWHVVQQMVFNCLH